MNREEYEELEDQFDGLYDKWLVAKQRIKHLESGPGGIMEMKQTIADKETEIERLKNILLEIKQTSYEEETRSKANLGLRWNHE